MPKSSETPEWLSVTCWWQLVGCRTMTGGDAVVRPGRQWGGSAQLRDDCGRVAGEDRAQGLGRQHLDLLHHGRQGWGLLWPSTWQRFWSTCLNSRIKLYYVCRWCFSTDYLSHKILDHLILAWSFSSCNVGRCPVLSELWIAPTAALHIWNLFWGSLHNWWFDRWNFFQDVLFLWQCC